MIFRTFLVSATIVEGNRGLLQLQAQYKLHIAWSQCHILLSVSTQPRIVNISNRLAKLITICIISDLTESKIF